MGLPKSTKRFSPAEYYLLERDANYKSDYYKGEIFAMAGGTIRASTIASNLVREIGNRLKGKPCRAYESNLRLKIAATGLRTYPNVSVYCEPLIRDDEDPTGETLINPTVIFEVLSPSTEAYDRGLKAGNYRLIESLQSYILVSQEKPHVEVHERQPNGSFLILDARGIEAKIRLSGIAVELPLSEIYDGVDFNASPEVTP